MRPVDDYLDSLDGPVREVFRHVLDLAMAEVPGAEQATSYGMAALKHRGKPLLGFRAASHHLSIFPFSPQAIDAVRADLGAFDVAKGTIRFDASTPLPDDVVRRLVRARRAEIEG